MSYNINKLPKLQGLKDFAEFVAKQYATKIELSALSDKIGNIKSAEYDIVKEADTGEYSAVYRLTKDGANVGAAINIPKDMVVSSGVVVTDPEGRTAGTYLKLVLANAEASEIYIPVDSLIEYVTSGSKADDAIVIAVDSITHQVTAAITDGSIGKTKLDASIQAAIDSVANKVDRVEGKGLSTNDFTNSYKTKLDSIEIATDAEVKEMLTEVFGTTA